MEADAIGAPDLTTSGAKSKRAKKDFVNGDYKELKRIIVENRLLEKQSGYYVYKIALTFALAGLTVFGIWQASTWWQLMLVAAFAGFASSQVAFLGHDAGHRQIARTTRGNDLIGYLVANILSGVCFTWWMDDHNRHHSHTNDLELDPNVDYPVLAFDRSQLADKKGWQLWIIKHQKYFFFPILSLAGINLKAGSVKFMIENKFPTRTMEAMLMAFHYAWYFGLLAYFLGWWALPFIVVHQISWGVFLGSVFAPNHKGMPLMEGESRRDYLRVQVLTSRNVRAHPVTDFMYGGLNYQIEHHLFPSIPRNRMRELQKQVKSFCEAHQISYHETSTLQSYHEIIDHLEEVSAPLHETKSAKQN